MKYVSNKNGDHCVFTAKTGRLVASMYNAKETKMVLDALNKTDIEENGEWCEGCHTRATKYDAEGVSLCYRCYTALDD